MSVVLGQEVLNQGQTANSILAGHEGFGLVTFSAGLAGGVLASGPIYLLDLLVRVNGSVASVTLVQVVVVVLGQAVLAPITIAVSVALYFDLRARKEPGSVPSVPLTDAPALARPLPPTPETGTPWP